MSVKNNKNWINTEKKPYVIGCRVTEDEQKEFDKIMKKYGFSNQTETLRFIIGTFINNYGGGANES